MKAICGDTVQRLFQFESEWPSPCLSPGIRAGSLLEAHICAGPFEVMLRWVFDVFLVSRLLSGV